MALRQIDIYVSSDSTALTFLDEEPHLIKVAEERGIDETRVVRVLLEVEDTEALVDKIQSKCSSDDAFRIVVQSVEATVPRFPVVEDEEEAEDARPNGGSEEEEDSSVARVSREELYQDVADTVQLSWVYVVMVALSTIVAAGGLLTDSIPVVIGAMVIAPLFGPNVALSLATTLGDAPLARRSLTSNIAGLATALVLSIAVGMAFPVDSSLASIAAQTDIIMGDVLLALTAGVAGALSFTQGISGALIGVMVAVALLPPLVVTGMLIGAGQFDLAVHSGILVLTNVISVNLAGVATFLIQGIHPGNWWEAREARRNTWYALGAWFVLLVVLLVLILYL